MSRVIFCRFPFEKKAYPRSTFPMTPQLRVQDLWMAFHRHSRERHVFDEAHIYFRGRYALFHAMQACRRKSRDVVLVSAYHCTTMVDPILRCGFDPWFYLINADLSPNLEHVEQLLERGKERIRCFVVTHYFGFGVDTSRLRAILNVHGIEMIEDCAHVMEPTTMVGRSGSMSIFSLPKLAPCPDGGVLHFNNASVSDSYAPHRVNTRRELRGLVQMVKTGIGTNFRRFRSVDAGSVRRPIVTEPVAEEMGFRSIDTAEILRNQSPFFDTSLENRAASLWSLKVWKSQDFQTIRKRRRENFRWWLSVVDGVSRCHALFSVLADDVVPYVFPLVLEQPGRHYDSLKRMGMPLYRWDECAVSDCNQSNVYRTCLVQLPCHHQIGVRERKWLQKTLELGLAT